jgi:hypothetical protein
VFHDELELLLIETADVDDVAVLLSQEVELDTSGHAGQRVDSDSWRHFLEPKVLELLNRPFVAYLERVPGSPDRLAAKTRAQEALTATKPALIHVYEEHATAGRVWRQRTETRKRNLSSAMIVLAPLVIALAILMVVGSSLSAADVFITAIAGALAGTLARMYKLRDVFTITKMRGLYADFFVQPFVGATIALFVLGLLFSGIVQLPGQSPLSWPTYATYGFVAAFSEPFFLKLVGRVGEVGDLTSQEKRSDSQHN